MIVPQNRAVFTDVLGEAELGDFILNNPSSGPTGPLPDRTCMVFGCGKQFRRLEDASRHGCLGTAMGTG
jgi:hypothetical protein